ncbi:Alpha/beta hydrolase fold-1 [Schizophyllum amplum]|uniref:Alpha/beta hydrolase fold-1 n=1 Tax=Schizophyllum amplum TaxID=97359 RepID=A0A550CQD6_9AGAR|nr:Alpha/beta hydrolase fold-1 [Auriculariopsis ampla]
MVLQSRAYTFDARPDYPLLVSVKRYWDPQASSDAPDALTLVWTHATGFHNEVSEPVIEDLYALHGLRIHDMWAIECPNHGASAALNERELQFGYEPVFGWSEYARAVHLVLTGQGTGVDVDFSKRRLVGIGQSMGAVALELSLTYFPRIPYHALVLVEPMVMNREAAEGPHEFLVNGARNRRDVWPSKPEAYKLLKSRGWKSWDDRVLRLFVEHGMRSLPTAEYPDKTEGVTLACPKRQEAASYEDPLGVARCYGFLKHGVKRVPTHIIYGAIDDYIPAFVKDDVIANAIGGKQHLASLSRVENAGHLVVQTNPKGLAEKIHQALRRHSVGPKL